LSAVRRGQGQKVYIALAELASAVSGFAGNVVTVARRDTMARHARRR
jgi:hypothetical protein